MTPVHELSLGGMPLGTEHPVFFIADIGSNHDGDLERAKAMIFLAAEAGADAAKFQHIRADSMASDFGFRSLGPFGPLKDFTGSVYELYESISMDPAWTPVLAETCKRAGIPFLTTATSPHLVHEVDPYVCAHKVASGDMTWTDLLVCAAEQGKPVILSTGVATMEEVERAARAVLDINPQLVLMQCTTSYSGGADNFHHVNLNVLKTYAERYPGTVLGLSDHAPGHAAVLGAIALGARVSEKHFTDDTTRAGADHALSMDATTWRDMVTRSRELELALGSGDKKIAENEVEWAVLQRRALRAARAIAAGTVLSEDLLIPLRPFPPDSVEPYRLAEVCGKALTRDIQAGERIRWSDLA